MLEKINSMSDFYQKVLYMYEHMDVDNMDEIIFILKTPEFQWAIQYYISRKMNNEVFSETDYQCIFFLVGILQSVYNYTSEDTGVSDRDFDILQEILEEEHMDIVSMALKTSHNVVHHNYPNLRGTLEKVYSLGDGELANKNRKSLDDWIRKTNSLYKKNTGEIIDVSKEEVYLFPKWNGISVIHEFDKDNNLIRSLTRGDTELNEAEDVTNIFKMIESKVKENVPKDFNLSNGESINEGYGLKTEVIVTDEVFEEYNKTHKETFKSARALCQSIILGEPDGREQLLEVKKLRIEQDGVEEVANDAYRSPFVRCLLSNTKAIENFANHHKTVEGCDCDGVVIYIIKSDIQKGLGRDRTMNQFEVAYKFTEETGYSKIKDIRFQIGPLGKITPIAVINPIVLKGNTIENISLGSYNHYNELRLAKGDKVKILYDTVPYLVMDDSDTKCKRSGKEPIMFPKKCPECKEEFTMGDNGTPKCENSKCPCRRKGKILNFMKKLGIKGIDYITISKLYDCDIIKDISDVFKMNTKFNFDNDTKEFTTPYNGIGAKMLNNLIIEIEEHRTVPVSVLYGALGIVGANRKTFEAIFKVFTPRELMDFAEENVIEALLQVKGIKEKKAKNILEGLRENERYIKYFEKVLTITEDHRIQARFVVVFHKIRSDIVEKIIEEKHGRVDDNVTKATDYLIVPSLDMETNTMIKAMKYGAALIPINQAEEFFKTNFR